MKETEEMRNQLMSFGIDTSLENSPSLTIGSDTKKNYHQLMRVLKRLTENYQPTDKFLKKVFEGFTDWRKEIQFDTNKYQTLATSDKNRLIKLFDFDKQKIKPVGFSLNSDTVLSIYEGPIYRQRRIYIGQMRQAVELPSGSKVRTVILISKETAVFLNWINTHFPVQSVDQQYWDSLYSSRTDNSFFGVFAHFMIDKLNELNANYHEEPLNEIFTQFYLDYTVSYSGVMQKRIDEQMRSESIATAYLTKKNIPEEIAEYMNQTKLLQLFDFVEFDEDIKRNELKQFEKDVLFFTEDPLFQHKVKSLRIRKLGKHSSQNKTTHGLYYPSLDNISLDLRSLNSFVHEWGHALDSHYGRLSTHNTTFREDIHSVVVHSLHKDSKLTEDRAYYYSMPSEVFARAFEWYIFDKYQPQRNNALYSLDDYTSKDQFIVYEQVDHAVREFFDQLTEQAKKRTTKEKVKQAILQ